MLQLNQFKIKKIALIVSLGLVLGGCASSPTNLGSKSAGSGVPSMANYFPVEVQNNVGPGASQNGVTAVYLLFTGKQMASPNPTCLMSLSPTTVPGYNAWIASCQNLTLQTQVSQYSYPMSTLQPNSNPVLIYIPNVISGRTFVSLNNSLDMPITIAADGSLSIQAPSLSNPTDGNYNLIYDKFEYTYDNTDTFWIDTTSVDDFALPIALSYTDPTTQATQLNGYTNQDRSTIITSIQNVLSSQGNSNWQHLVVKDSVSNTGTIMRIDAPNTSPDFNPNYLTALNGYGFNYVNALIKYYSNSAHAILVNCSEVDSPKYPEYVKLGNGTDPNAYIFKGYVVGNKFVFTNEPSNPADSMVVSIDLSKAQSIDFFGPGQAPFDTPNGTVRSVMIKNLTAAFSVGLLPAKGGTTLNNLFSTSHTNYYTTNSILKKKYNAYNQVPTGKGPWFDLYAHAVHSTAADPVYAFAFDDVLKQDGTISVSNSSPGPTVAPVIITLGSVDNLVVPSPGPNYNANPQPNNVFPVSNVAQTSFSCSGSNCTLAASWNIPAYQDTSVKYFILPTPSPTETSTVLQNESLLNYGATQGSITFPVSLPAPKLINQVTVYACIPSNDITAKGYDCPSVGNGYTFGSKVVGASSPAAGVQLQPVTITSNSNFNCNGTNCSLTATWTIPSNEPSGATFYILPLPPAKAPMPDIMNGQSLTTGTTGTLTVPQADVTTLTSATTVAVPIVVSACMNDSSAGLFCPSASNNYNQSTTVGSVPFPNP